MMVKELLFGFNPNLLNKLRTIKMNPTPSKMSEIIFRMAAAMGKVAQDTENQELYGPSMASLEAVTDPLEQDKISYMETLEPQDNVYTPNPRAKGVNASPETLKTDAQSLQTRTLELLKFVSCNTFGHLGKWIVTISGTTCLLFYKWEGVDNNTNAQVKLTSRKYYISPNMLDVEIVQTAFLCLKTALEHELREAFKYKGVAVFGPHLDLDTLTTVTTKARE